MSPQTVGMRPLLRQHLELWRRHLGCNVSKLSLHLLRVWMMVQIASIVFGDCCQGCIGSLAFDHGLPMLRYAVSIILPCEDCAMRFRSHHALLKSPLRPLLRSREALACSRTSAHVRHFSPTSLGQHLLYQSFVFLHVPDAQAVGPEYPWPPHWAYKGAVGPLPPPGAGVGVGVGVGAAVVEGVPGLGLDPPLSLPEHVSTAGPGIWYGRPLLKALPEAS